MNTNQQEARIERQRMMRAPARVCADVPFTSEHDIPLGAHLVTSRGGYDHHGIYVGEGKVVHYAGFAGGRCRGPVDEVALGNFAAGNAIAIRPDASPRYMGVEAVQRARSRLGENRYRLLTNNCEHFCAWCVSGESRSQQVKTCFTHPRAGVHALVSLLKVLVVAELKVTYAGVRAA